MTVAKPATAPAPAVTQEHVNGWKYTVMLGDFIVLGLSAWVMIYGLAAYILGIIFIAWSAVGMVGTYQGTLGLCKSNVAMFSTFALFHLIVGILYFVFWQAWVSGVISLVFVGVGICFAYMAFHHLKGLKALAAATKPPLPV